MTDDEFMLTLKIEGISEVERARAAYLALMADTGKAEAAVDRVGAAGKRSGKGLDDAGKSGKNGAMGLMALSNAADDVQYGIRGVVNNIPGMVSGLGLGVGVAGAAQLAAVAVNQLVIHWDAVQKMFQNSAFVDAAADMRSLADAAEKLKASLPRSIDVGQGIEAIQASGKVQAAVMSAVDPKTEVFRKRAKGDPDAFLTSRAIQVMAAGTNLEDPDQSMYKSVQDMLDAGMPAMSPEVAALYEAKQRKEATELGKIYGQSTYDDKVKALNVQAGDALTDPDKLAKMIKQVEDQLATRKDLTGQARVDLSEFLKALKDLTNNDAPERIGKAFTQFADNIARGLNVAAREVESKTKEAADKESEKIGRAFGDMMEAAVHDIEVENRKRVVAAAEKAKKLAQMSPLDRPFAGQGDMTAEERIAANRGIAGAASQRFQQAQFAYMTAGNPNAARLLRQQMANADRFNAPGSALSMLQRQTFLRANGGIDAINQREKAAQVMYDSTVKFQQAVENLARDGVPVRVR